MLDALNVGMLMMERKPEAEVEKAIMEFITRYGLLGLMTALPTTPSFMDYEAVYLPKNHFIKEESMATDKYLSLFYPFDQLDLVKKGIESTWNVSGDRTMVALTMTFMDEPMAKNMSFQREYAEPYDWVAQQFKDWAFTLTTAILYYGRADSTQPNMGLTTWKNAPKGRIRKSDVTVAKNYLNETEMRNLNEIVTMYLDYAERQARRGNVMYMADWVKRLDAFLQFNEEDILHDKGKVTAAIAKAFAEKEFEKFRVLQDRTYQSDFDRLVAETSDDLTE